VRTPWTERERSQIFFAPLGRTKQSFKDECNINNIMAKYARTGVIEHGNKHAPSYGDCPEIDFRQAMEVVLEAQETFAELPAVVRRRFDNDPANFLAFCEDPANRDEAGELGLLKLIEPEPAPSPEPPPAPPAASPGAD
jgi:phage internal scaffolding protein